MAYDNNKVSLTTSLRKATSFSSNILLKKLLRCSQLSAKQKSTKFIKDQDQEQKITTRNICKTKNIQNVLQFTNLIELTNEKYLPQENVTTILKPLIDTTIANASSTATLTSCNETNVSCFCVSNTKTISSANCNYLSTLKPTNNTSTSTSLSLPLPCLPKIRTATAIATTLVRGESTASVIPVTSITTCRSNNSNNNSININTFNFTSLRFIILVLYLILTSCVGVSLQLKNGKICHY